MTKQTKIILGVGALVLVGYLFWKKSNANTKQNAIGNRKLARKQERKRRATMGGQQGGCVFQGGTCVDGSGNAQPVGTILDGNRVIVSNSSSNCLVCPKSDTESGLPISV